MRTVTVSAKWARTKFEGCSPEYIRTTCHGRCCRSSVSDTGTCIPVRPHETPALLGYPGVRVENNLLIPREGEHRCPFQEEEGFCALHNTGHKPLGCVLSPWVLNKQGRLIIRIRYIRLACHRNFKETGTPAYLAFATSLRRLFGDVEAQRIIDYFDGGGMCDVTAEMSDDLYESVQANTATLEGLRGYKEAEVGVQ